MAFKVLPKSTKICRVKQDLTSLTDIDHLSNSMVFPSDYLKNEKFNYSVLEYFKEIFKHIEQTENNLLVHLKVTKKNINCSNLLIALFERNDFQLFEGFIKVALDNKYFYLRVPAVRINLDNSAMLCGEIVCIILKLANVEGSFMREYRKKIYEIINDQIYHLIRLIMSSYTVPIDKSIQSSNLTVSSFECS